MTPQETALDLPVSVQESPVEGWVGGGLLWSRGRGGGCAVTVAVHAWDLLKDE